jgi:membrane protein implicated in regulation of membrane protease activity
VFAFLVKVLVAHDHTLRPAEYRLEGTLATVVTAIGEDRTGEVVFSQGGSRHAAGARSEDGRAIPAGTEVVITRYAHGLAYVRRWQDVTGDESGAVTGDSAG